MWALCGYVHGHLTLQGTLSPLPTRFGTTLIPDMFFPQVLH